MIHSLKCRLVVMKNDQTNTPYNFASDVQNFLKTLRITPHGITNEIKMKPELPKSFQTANSPPQQKTGANSKVIKIAKDKLNVR